MTEATEDMGENRVMSKQSFENAAANGQQKDDIPEPKITWYTGPDDPQIQADLETAAQLTDKLVNKYKGRIATLNAAELLEFMQEIDQDSIVAYKIGGYLSSYLSSKDIKKYGDLSKAADQKMTELFARETIVNL